MSMPGVPDKMPGFEDNDEEDDGPQSAGLLSGGDGIQAGDEVTDLDKIFEKMLNPNNIYHFTELNPGEITAFSSLGCIAELHMPKGVIHKWLILNLMMRVSKGRKGKQEFVKITARNADPPQMMPQRNGFNWFRGN